MKKSNLGMLAASAAFLVFAHPAHALAVTVGGSIADNTLLGAGAHAGAFDLSAALQPNSRIGSASYSFTFTDDSDALTTGPRIPFYPGWGTSQWVLTSSSGIPGVTDMYYHYSRNSTSTYTQTNSRAGEGAAVTLGSASFAAGSGATTTTTSTQSSGPTFVGSTQDTYIREGRFVASSCNTPFSHGCGYYSPGEYTYSTTNNYVVDNVTLNDQTGTFTVSGSITDAALLAEMNTRQSLSYSLDVWGDLMLSSATLTLDVNNTVAAVPEPSTFALAGAGMAMMAVVVRRRRQQGAGRFG